MTPAELKAETDYLYTERLGMLCEDREPTEQEQQIAKQQCDDYRKEHGPKKQLKQEEMFA